MKTAKAPHSRRHRRYLRTLLRRCCIAIFLLAAVGATAAFHFTRPHRIAAFADEMLESLTGGDVEIGSASFSLDGTVLLHDLEMTVPGLEGEGAQLFYAETALLKLDPLEAIRGRFVASEMLVLRPTLSLTEVAPDRFNYEQLRRDSRVSSRSLPTLPRIYVRDGRVRYGEVHDERYHTVGTLHVGGQLSPDPARAGLYHFELAPQPEDYAANPEAPATALAAVVHPTLRGRFDLESFDVSVEVNDFAFVDPHRNMLPRQIRRWWDLFEPSGSLPNVRFDYDPVTGPAATVDVKGVSLSLPQLSDVDFKARMSDVSGTFHFDAEQIRVENLVGEIEGLQYRINGIIDGYSAEAPFQLAVDTQPFRIPEEPRFMPAMPLDVQEVFNQLTPVGWMRVSLTLLRDEADQPVDYHGSANILSGRELVAELMRDPRYHQAEQPLNPNDPRFSSTGQYHRFPYPIHDVSGLVTFNSEAIEVKRLTGKTSGGGRVSLTGTIAPPSPEATVDLHVSATNLRFDDALHSALRDSQQRIVDLFFDEEHYNRLREAGHFISADDRDLAQRRHRETRQALDALPADSADREALTAQLAALDALLERPVFDLGGRFNLELDLQRKLMGDERGGLETRIDLSDLNVVFEHFPYPLRVAGGELLITADGLDFKNVQARGLADAGRASLAGRVDMVREDDRRRPVPQLKLTAQQVPIDALLVDVVPQPHDRWLRELNPAGFIDIDGRIIENTDADFDSPIGFDVAIAYDNATLAPGLGRYPLSDAEGRLRLTPNQLRIEAFHGRHDDARLQLTGQADFAKNQPATLELAGNGTGMRLEDHVLDLVAPAVGHSDWLEKFWDRYKPAGRFDAAFEYRTRDGDEPHYQVQLQPGALAFDHEGYRVALGDVEGSVSILPGRVQLDQLTGRFDDDQTFAVDGGLTLGATPTASLSLNLQGRGLSPTLEHLAPDTIAGLFTTAEFDGAYQLNAPRVDLTLGENGDHQARLRATLHLEDARFDFGVPVTAFNGSIALDLRQDEKHDWPTLEMGLHAPSLHAAGRPVDDLAMAMRNEAGSPALGIDSLTATVAQGNVDGRGGVHLDRGSFQLQLVLDDARLRHVLNGNARPASARRPHDPSETGGIVLSAARASEDADDDADDDTVIELPDADPGNEVDGRLSLSLAVEGGWKDDRAIRGRGDLSIRDANLRGLPLAMGLLQMTHLTLPADQTFQRATSTYYIHEDRVVFETLQLDAPAMRIGGSGSLNYRSRALDLTLTTSNPAGLNLGPLTTIIDGFRNQLVTLRITGTTADPVLRIRQLDGLSEAWRDVLGE